MKGIVAEIKGDRAVILTQHGEFVEVFNKEYTVGEKITYTKPSYQKYVAIAACLILCLLVGFSGYSVYSQPVSFVSMDINPSFRFDVNRFDKVVKINALNDEATALLSILNIGSKDVGEVVKQVISKAEEMGYINEDNNKVEINVTSDNEKVIEKVEQVTQPYVNHQVEVTVERAGAEEAKQAKDMNISVGKLKAVQEYTNVYGGTVQENANKLKNIPNGKIRKDIREAEAVKAKIENKNVKDGRQDKQPVRENKKNNNKENIHTDRSDDKIFKQQSNSQLKGNPRNIERPKNSANESKAKNDGKSSNQDKESVKENRKNNNEKNINPNRNDTKKNTEKSNNQRMENKKNNTTKSNDKNRDNKNKNRER